MVLGILARGLTLIPAALQILKSPFVKKIARRAVGIATIGAIFPPALKAIADRPLETAGLVLAPLPAAAAIAAREFEKASVDPNITLISGVPAAIRPSGRIVRTFPKKKEIPKDLIKKGLIAGGVVGAIGAGLAVAAKTIKKGRDLPPGAVIDFVPVPSPLAIPTAIETQTIPGQTMVETVAKKPIRRRGRAKKAQPINVITQIQNSINL